MTQTVMAQAMTKAVKTKAKTRKTARKPAHNTASCLVWPTSYPFDDAIDKLQKAGVNAVADLRSPILIRTNTGATPLQPAKLKPLLKNTYKLAYVRLDALGNSPDHHQGRPPKSRLQDSDAWQADFKRLLNGVHNYQVCVIMDSPILERNTAYQALINAKVDVYPIGEYRRLQPQAA